MNDDLSSELLDANELGWLAGYADALSLHSPLTPFVGLGDETAAEALTQRGLTTEPWQRVFAAMRRPGSLVRVTVPGVNETMVQYFVGDGRSDGGLVGCWLEGDGLRVSFPWTDSDVVSLASQAIFSTPPDSVDVDPIVLTADGFAALSAAIDALRSQYFAAMAGRLQEVDHRLDQEMLAAQAAAGVESADARWLVPMLGLTGFLDPVSADAVVRGIAELAATGLLVDHDGGWRPGPGLLRLAGWWRNPLPAVSYETTRLAGDEAIRHDHRVVIRGEGPLCVLHRSGASVASVSIGTVAPLEYFDELTRALNRVVSDQPEYVYVLEPVPVRDHEVTTAVVGYLQPGRWYAVERDAGVWAYVRDADGPLEGWAPGAELYRRIEVPETVPAVEPPTELVEEKPEPVEPMWQVTHVVAPDGLTSWAVPDGATAPIADLAAGVEFQVVEWRSDWARVRAENTWEGWVDGRRLVAVSTATAPAVVARSKPVPRPQPAGDEQPDAKLAEPPRARDRVAVGAVIAIFLSAFLPWVGINTTATDVSAVEVLTLGAEPADWPSASAFVFLLGFAGLASVLRPGLRRFRPVVGMIAAGFGALHCVFVVDEAIYWYEEPNLVLGALATDYLAIGAFVLIAAGVVLTVRR